MNNSIQTNSIQPNMRERMSGVVVGLCAAVVVVSACVALAHAWHWPLLGDAALIRYVVFLMRHGHAPYTHIFDINLPGSYLIEATAMRLFGDGAVGLRLYDGALCLAGCGFMVWLSDSGWRPRLLGLIAGLLLLLIHLQDGLGQSGQRDFAMAVIALGACAVLLRWKQAWASVLIFEALVGLLCIIKPTMLPLALLPLLMRKRLTLSMLGLFVAPAAMLLWLWRWHAIRGFVQVFNSIAVLHGQMGRRTLGFLLAHCTSPILVLFVLWVLVLIVAKPRLDAERKALLFAAGCGLISYLAQGKAYPYQRYPFLAFCLLLIFRDLARAMPGRAIARWLALATVSVSCLWFAPHFASMVSAFTGQDVVEQQLGQDLRRVGVSSVQCLDTFGGCVNTLYDLGVTQSTGYLYDCYLFSTPSAIRESYREGFLRAFDAARPNAVVLTDQFCFSGERGFGRVATWPELDSRLKDQYKVETEWHAAEKVRWSSRWEDPAGYRLYVRK